MLRLVHIIGICFSFVKLRLRRRQVAFAAVAICCALSTLDSVQAQTPYRYDVELNQGPAMLGVWMYYDSLHDANLFWPSDTSRPIALSYRKVRRILSISDPIRPPRQLPWSEIKDTLRPYHEPEECDCLGHERRGGLQLLDAKLGLSYKGTNSYTRVTQNGQVVQESKFFSPFNAGSTQLDVELNAAAGWRAGHWDLGLMLEVIPTDSFFFFPLALHARFAFDESCCAWNVFANVGLPFDLQTGAPILLTPLFSNRQRRYVSLGVGKTWPFSESLELAVDLGYRYMVIPLAEIQCCPSIAFQNRFPARESNSVFLQCGVSF